MASKLAELHRELNGLRRDIEEIREILIPEVPPSAKDRKAVARGGKEYAHGEAEEWGDVQKRVAEQ